LAAFAALAVLLVADVFDGLDFALALFGFSMRLSPRCWNGT